MRNILVALDFSPGSDRALRRAVLLAETSGAALHLVHVAEEAGSRRETASRTGTAADLLARLAQHTSRSGHGLVCETDVATGNVEAELVRLAAEAEADLVVLGPEGRRGLADLLVSQRGEAIVRASTRPVLTVNAFPAGPYRTALVGIDLSAGSRAAVAAAVALDLADPLVALHVFDAPALGLMTRSSASQDEIADYLDHQRAAAMHECTEFLTAADVAHWPLHLEPVRGTVGGTICATADALGADLTVVGTRGRTGLARVVLGSVAAEVVRGCSCDVLTVPPPP